MQKNRELALLPKQSVKTRVSLLSLYGTTTPCERGFLEGEGLLPGLLSGVKGEGVMPDASAVTPSPPSPTLATAVARLYRRSSEWLSCKALSTFPSTVRFLFLLDARRSDVTSS